MKSNFDLKTLIANPPKLHMRQGQLISNWRIDDTTCLELNRRLKPGMRTLETGAGLSTIIFAANGCKHTCIVPDKDLADRIKDYCRSAKISTRNVHFVISKSTDVIHQKKYSGFDLILIDGCHGLPTVFVDFYYATKALKLGGTLIVDDMHIYSCRLAARFMQSDPGWNVELVDKRVAFATKVSDTTIDSDWGAQRFVTIRSYSAMRHPVISARAVLKGVRTHGARGAMRKLLKRISDKRRV